ncbi:acylneuraminate cytidylyltransferase [Microbacterium sp. CnD16-F]|uniref:cytidylyltransferase domain-containing protein n=1 Tax=Microbacterium sp. CnD16-F TaxID=2954493 RepID=UPI0020985296|nr:acylneuraminate cytidylyltransferase [Microbacterium sp. CnD16-F]MCO7204476.1 acylneuraminate cytidylyltransferase [Microbacterium sp. CnD16-F]
MTPSTAQTIAIIPARGGSKGVPGKNVARVGGIPLVARAVRAALTSGAIDLVVVSTDDAAIADAARAAGARVVDRPADISGDQASSESALLHALDTLAAEGITPRVTAFLQATSPFIPAAALGEAVALVRGGRADSVFSARESYEFVWRRDAAGAASALGHDAAHRPRRQDRDPHYVETGAFYVFTTDGFREARHRFFGRTGIVEVPEESAIEIDDPAHLRTAQTLAHLLEPAEPLAARVVVTDFDGVHTDDSAWVDAAGTEHVRVSRSDGMGVALLRRAGVPVLILSTEQNAVVRARAEKLQVEVIHGVDDKATVLRQWATDRGIDLAETAYLGNDVNDLPAMALVGWPVAVADARPDVVAAARVVLTRPGGAGAVRELADRVLAAR